MRIVIVFQVSLNFDPAKEIPKIWCNIYILTKKVIILRKVQWTMKTFAPPFFNHFSLSLNKKKMCGSESHEKETLEAVVHRHSSKKVFLKDLKARNFIKNRLQHRCFPGRLYGWIYKTLRPSPLMMEHSVVVWLQVHNQDDPRLNLMGSQFSIFVHQICVQNKWGHKILES